MTLPWIGSYGACLKLTNNSRNTYATGYNLESMDSMDSIDDVPLAATAQPQSPSSRLSYGSECVDQLLMPHLFENMR